jgi:hypothetical protein
VSQKLLDAAIAATGDLPKVDAQVVQSAFDASRRVLAAESTSAPTFWYGGEDGYNGQQTSVY